ncbi:MAG: hypothetical protein ACKO3R_01250 [bacterium]
MIYILHQWLVLGFKLFCGSFIGSQITGLLTQFYQGSKKIYQASFAKREFIPVARAMSNHIAKSSGNFLYTLQQKLKSKLIDPSISLNFREDLKDLAI